MLSFNFAFSGNHVTDGVVDSLARHGPSNPGLRPSPFPPPRLTAIKFSSFKWCAQVMISPNKPQPFSLSLPICAPAVIKMAMTT